MHIKFDWFPAGDLDEKLLLFLGCEMDGNGVLFRIKRFTQLKKAPAREADSRRGLPPFLSLLIRTHRLEMKDGDEIDAMLHQTGGAMA
ncbi:hypothetical protein SLEP1_g46626 [Rubroshorea leprosula]|uniref:Uncharacterized protein n=1 Tax=Rubroshorea leprosula TaxID=152421 RepID=A0AAV5LNI2_9ROSI|nr:hypothetical protein SLEP1_g46626 [Rubroshorea leprosula]